MRALPKQTTASQCQVSSLRQCLKTPQLWLGVLAALALAFFGDTFRAPSRQLSPRLYGGLVSGYRWTKSQIGVKPRCRFSPSCSQYSQQAVRRYGLWKGLRLTFRRLCRCRTNVPPETRDPLPGVASYQDRHELASFLSNSCGRAVQVICELRLLSNSNQAHFGPQDTPFSLDRLNGASRN